jgi:predicted ATP-grasp superfamily ATP-dependent carboligase
LTEALGVRGLASADFLDDGKRLWLLEINPRPGATLDLFDDANDPLIARHLAACQDLPMPPPAPRRPGAVAIAYAVADCIAPSMRWPAWAADRPAPGSALLEGAPICTVTAADRTSAHARAAEIRQVFQEGVHG